MTGAATGKRVILGVSGGIAAYKACSLLRLFTESGYDVTVVPTAAALRFVGAPTWAALSGKPVSADVWTDVHEVPHVRLGQHADLVVVAPATADLMAKIADTVPERLRPFVLEPASRARPGWNREPDRIDMVRTRTQIHEGKKITLNYRDEQGRDSERTIWPVAVGYLEAVRLLAAWCELRRDFRSFRTDRVISAVYHDEKYPERRDLLRAKWRRSLVWEAPKDT